MAATAHNRLLWVFVSIMLLALAGKWGFAAAAQPSESLGFFLMAIFMTAALFYPAEAVITMLLLPSLMGKSVVKSFVTVAMLGDFRLYTFDLMLILISGSTLLTVFYTKRERGARYLTDNRWVIILLIAGICAKVIEGVWGGSATTTLRNSAMFYYPALVPFLVSYFASNDNLRQDIVKSALAGLAILLPATVVLTISLWLGEPGRFFEYNEYGGAIVPTGIFSVFTPPMIEGSMVLLAALCASLLPHRGVSIGWKMVLIAYMLFDVAWYANRAMWLAIVAGISVGVLIEAGRKVFIASVVAGILVVALLFNPLRSLFDKQHHGTSEWRLAVWGMTLARIAEHPLIGHNFSEFIIDEDMYRRLVKIFGKPGWALAEERGGQTPVVEVQRKQATGLGIEASEGRRGLPSPLSVGVEDGLRDLPPPLAIKKREPLYPHNSFLSLIYYGGAWLVAAVLFLIGRVMVGLLRYVWVAHDAGAPHEDGLALIRAVVAVLVYVNFNVALETPTEALGFWLVIALGWVFVKNRVGWAESRTSAVPILQ